jgi:hypothetical protein
MLVVLATYTMLNVVGWLCSRFQVSGSALEIGVAFPYKFTATGGDAQADGEAKFTLVQKWVYFSDI